MGKRIESIMKFFSNKVIWKRIILTIFAIGLVIMFIVIDYSCDAKNMTCSSKSNVHIDIKKSRD